MGARDRLETEAEEAGQKRQRQVLAEVDPTPTTPYERWLPHVLGVGDRKAVRCGRKATQ